jgi:hypothetical protein
MSATSATRTVLFLHGLESGPNGHKAQALKRAGFNVVAGKMPCSRREALLLDWPVLTGIASAALAVVAATVAAGPMGFLASGAAAGVLFPVARAALVRRIVRRSVAVQLELLRTHRVDVVVGSSFGGAVGVHLLHSGAWRGPTVLLCPAHRGVMSYARLPTPSLPTDVAHLVTVVHGRSDTTVPIEHSRELVAGTAAVLVEVDDNHCLSASATPAALAQWVNRSLDAARPPTAAM